MGVEGLEVERLEVPHEPDQWMELRKRLPPYKVDRAVRAATHAKEVAAATLVGELVHQVGEQVADTIVREASQQAANGQNGRKAEAAAALTRERIDLDHAAVHTIVRWSYVHPVSGRPVPVGLEQVRSLDRETRAWLHDRVWEAARPPSTEETEGNSSRPSAT